ncbi:hypothetical protein QCE63_05375 [Caballeronia sp. LZ065]|uniref:hypothetical protein n=1 Tax=Caballeronia sp. LZ065 TaxID=3038571 RepID=UPI00285948DD|nr:hypothetical protein [Caballeronia sp. LZ065]MDR5778859.1 hypothetical protein [Caballeronia sp. LZ065]
MLNARRGEMDDTNALRAAHRFKDRLCRTERHYTKQHDTHNRNCARTRHSCDVSVALRRGKGTMKGRRAFP